MAEPNADLLRLFELTVVGCVEVSIMILSSS